MRLTGLLRHPGRFFSMLSCAPRSFLFCLHYFPFKTAVKLPVLVGRYVKRVHMEGKIVLQSPPVAGMVKLGWFGMGGVSAFDPRTCPTIWDCRGTIVFEGWAQIEFGCSVGCGENAVLTFGDGFLCTGNSKFSCAYRLTFGKHCLISFENLFLDSDTHLLLVNGKRTNEDREIKIGNHVWVGCRNTVLKGTEIGSNSMVAAGSVLPGRKYGHYVIIAGNPAVEIRRDIEWQQ